MKGRARVVLCIGILLLAAAGACGNRGQQGPPPAVPVMAATVVQKTVPLEIRAIGNCQAYSTVEVKSLVEGEINQVHFTEGQDVAKGDLLFTIDPRPFEAALKQAEATLAKDKALAENAQADVKRYEFLIEKQAVARQQYDQILTNAKALEATVRVDQAAVDNAKLTLSYCFIRSPIDGTTGNLRITVGNVIKANDVPLVTINQIKPIYVAFSMPEQSLGEIKQYEEKGELKVEAFPTNDQTGGEEGTLTFIDNTVDTATGTILLKGTFSNESRRLWPGQFVNVRLILATQPNAIIVPSQAVQTGQEGPYVFVINPEDLTVEARPVVVNRTINNDTIIDKGLAPGEEVVTDGQLQLVPGAKVEIKGSVGGSEKGS